MGPILRPGVESKSSRCLQPLWGVAVDFASGAAVSDEKDPPFLAGLVE